MKTKSILTVAAFGAVLNFTAPGRAFAIWCQADAATVYGNMLSNFIPFIQNQVLGMGLGTERAVAESGAAVSGEVNKATMAEVAVEQGIESARQQEQLNNDAAALADTLQQPAATCTTISTASSIGQANLAVQRDAIDTSKRVLTNTSPATTVGTLAVVDADYRATNQRFCSPAEAAAGICTAATSSKYSRLAGADQDAAYLFQAPNGESSYIDDGVAQGEAADALIRRVVTGVPMDALPAKSSEFYSKAPAARAYVELSRRYNAMMSMSAFSLAQVRASAQVRKGLGTDTGMASVNVPGFASGKADMSMTEAVDRFVAMRFSPNAVTDLAKAKSSATILRDMAQGQNFQLWMAFEAQQRSSRTEALSAVQLVLLAERNLRPQIEKQRTMTMQAAMK